MSKTLKNPVQILSAEVHAGQVGLDGTLGCENIELSVPAEYRDWQAIGTHAPSQLHIRLDLPLEIAGVMNGSMRTFRADEGIVFSVNGDAFDVLRGPWDTTRRLILPTGEHLLTVDCQGNPEFSHSIWMCRTATKELATPENTVFISAAAYKENFDDMTKIFRRSAKRYGIPVVFVDRDKEFVGYYEHKIKAAGEELRRQKTLGKTFAFLLDCRDIFFMHSIDTILAKFNAMYEGRVIFNADFVGETWPVDKIWFLNILQHLKEKSLVNLNSGFICGEIDKILYLMEKIEEIRAAFFSSSPENPILARVYEEQGLQRQQDDQLWYHLCLALYPELIEVDEQKLLAAFIKYFPQNSLGFTDDPRRLDVVGKASVVHGAYPSHDSRWEEWADKMMGLSQNEP